MSARISTHASWHRGVPSTTAHLIVFTVILKLSILHVVVLFETPTHPANTRCDTRSVCREPVFHFGHSRSEQYHRVHAYEKACKSVMSDAAKQIIHAESNYVFLESQRSRKVFYI